MKAIRRTIPGILLALTLPLAGTAMGQGYNASVPEFKDMRLVGYNDLQGRSAYQPTAEQQGNRWIAYVGHHGGSALNPLTGVVEPNGTSIVDVTDPANPVYLKHIPGPPGAGEAGGAQMVRMCPGSATLGTPGKFYLLRTNGTQGHQVFDVTDPSNPVLLSTPVDGQTDTHKNWWECDTGIAYLVGAAPGWRTSRMTQIFDLSNPSSPKFIRNFGLPSQQPGATGPVEVQLHGPYQLANRVYFGYGTATNGILQIVDRDKLLNGDPAVPAADRFTPTPANLLYPQISRYDHGPTNGAHTVFPIMNMAPPPFQGNTSGKTRNIIALTNESTSNECRENPQLSYFIDITTETEPFGVGSFKVDPRSGGSVDFCARGGRFGTHSSDERINPKYYGKVLWLAYFNAGIRAVDIRDPWAPKEIAYYIPAITAKTDVRCVTTNGVETCKTAIQTNNLDSDNRGYVYAVDRANTGMHIVELTGNARKLIQ